RSKLTPRSRPAASRAPPTGRVSDPMSPVPSNLADATLPELRLALAPSVADAAVFDGWTQAAVDHAAALHQVEPVVARLAFPRGAIDMIAAWIERIDADGGQALPAEALAPLKVSERIRRLVEFRI